MGIFKTIGRLIGMLPPKDGHEVIKNLYALRERPGEDYDYHQDTSLKQRMDVSVTYFDELKQLEKEQGAYDENKN
jgi:hypothetical protein